MATIQQKISIVDKVSPALNDIQKNAVRLAKEYEKLEKDQELVFKQLEKLEAAGKQNSQMYKQLTSVYFEYDRQLANIADGNVKLAEAQEDVNQAQEQAKGSAKGMNLTMTELNQTLEFAKKAWGEITKVVREAYQWMEQYNKQFDAEYTLATKMKAALGANTDEIQDMYEYAKQLQKTGIIGDETILSGAKTLATSASSTEQLKRLTQAAADLAVAEYGIQGATQGYSSVTGYIQRALEGSASMLVRNKILTKAEADAIDKLTDKTEKENALLKAFNKYLGQSAIALETTQGQLVNARNRMSDFGEILGEKVTPYIEALETAIADMLEPAVEWLADNMDWIAPVFLSLAAVVGVVIVVMTALAIVNGIVTASWIGALGPILLAIAAIAAVIYLVSALINWIRSLRGEAQSALGAILGYIAMFIANVYNTAIVPLYNTIASFVNFLTNCMDHPLQSMAIAWIEFGTRVLNILNTIAQTIDTVFGTNLSSTVSGWISNLEKTKSEIKSSIGYKDTMPMLENLNVGEMYNKGAALGNGIADKLSKIQNAGGIKDVLDRLGSAIVTDSAGGIALNTTSKDDLLKEEDIQLLLDVATRDFKLEYRQITPEILIEFGDVHENADVDTILEKINEQVAEVYDSDLVGVAV